MARVQLDEDRDVESRYALGRIHSIESMGTVDGPGVRFVVFTQGAPCAARIATTRTRGPWARGRYVRIGRAPVGRIREQQAVLPYRRSDRHGRRAVASARVRGRSVRGSPMRRFAGRNIHTCLDSCGYAYNPKKPERFEKLLSETDMVPFRHR